MNNPIKFKVLGRMSKWVTIASPLLLLFFTPIVIGCSFNADKTMGIITSVIIPLITIPTLIWILSIPKKAVLFDERNKILVLYGCGELINGKIKKMTYKPREIQLKHIKEVFSIEMNMKHHEYIVASVTTYNKNYGLYLITAEGQTFVLKMVDNPKRTAENIRQLLADDAIEKQGDFS